LRPRPSAILPTPATLSRQSVSANRARHRSRLRNAGRSPRWPIPRSPTAKPSPELRLDEEGSASVRSAREPRGPRRRSSGRALT
jgi:hypothetical protein